MSTITKDDLSAPQSRIKASRKSLICLTLQHFAQFPPQSCSKAAQTPRDSRRAKCCKVSAQSATPTGKAALCGRRWLAFPSAFGISAFCAREIPQARKLGIWV